MKLSTAFSSEKSLKSRIFQHKKLLQSHSHVNCGNERGGKVPKNCLKLREQIFYVKT
jgi:hypothetical protein